MVSHNMMRRWQKKCLKFSHDHLQHDSECNACRETNDEENWSAFINAIMQLYHRCKNTWIMQDSWRCLMIFRTSSWGNLRRNVTHCQHRGMEQVTVWCKCHNWGNNGAVDSLVTFCKKRFYTKLNEFWFLGKAKSKNDSETIFKDGTGDGDAA